MIIIITGASSGVGQFLMQHFKDYKVFGTFNSTTISDPRFSKVDIRSYAEVEAWVMTLPFDKAEKIVLINCAGINYNCFAHKSDPMLWQDVINTNLIGTFNVIRNLLPLMRSAAFGRIINIGSVVAQKGIVGTSAYAASKSALWGLSKALAAENASKGVTVNTINLGYSDVGMGLTQISEEKRLELKSSIPAQRFSTAAEIAKTIEYLIETEYVNGTSIDINGGFF